MGKLINTPCGSISGVELDGVNFFKGVRYASAGRWEYPKIVESWDGVYNAESFGAACWQPRAFSDESANKDKAFYYREFREGDSFSYSEDCLFLNIWAPDNAEKLPVILYIHGGGFIGGCGSERHFDARELAKCGAVVVTINYRLMFLGFACLSDAEKEAGHTGNYALFDQLAALEWVRRNIASFGGDPEHITLMGQSAGAMCIQELCFAEQARGKFFAAVMMSGGGVSNIMKSGSVEASKQFWQSLYGTLGVETLEELRALDVKTLFDAFNKIGADNPREKISFCKPVVDGYLIKEPEIELANKGAQHNIPYLCGSTSEDLFAPIMHKMAKSWVLLQAAQKKQPSYCYFFSRQLPGDNHGAWHSSDLWYAFGSLKNCWRPFTERDRELSSQLMHCLVAFAKSGSPQCDCVPDWQPINGSGSRLMIFGDSASAPGKVSTAKLWMNMLLKKSVGF